MSLLAFLSEEIVEIDHHPVVVWTRPAKLDHRTIAYKRIQFVANLEHFKQRMAKKFSPHVDPPESVWLEKAQYYFAAIALERGYDSTFMSRTAFISWVRHRKTNYEEWLEPLNDLRESYSYAVRRPYLRELDDIYLAIKNAINTAIEMACADLLNQITG